MLQISHDDKYLYSVTKSGPFGVLFQFDVTNQSISKAKQYDYTELFDLKAFTSGSIVNGIIGATISTLNALTQISIF